MKSIVKNTFLQSQPCLTKGWYLHTKNIQTPLTQVEQFRINKGVELGKMARSLYQNGVLVNEGGVLVTRASFIPFVFIIKMRRTLDTDSLFNKIFKITQQGRQQQEIAKMLNINKSNMRRHIAQAKEGKLRGCASRETQLRNL